jgi:hypothetical protein
MIPVFSCRIVPLGSNCQARVFSSSLISCLLGQAKLCAVEIVFEITFAVLLLLFI